MLHRDQLPYLPPSTERAQPPPCLLLVLSTREEAAWPARGHVTRESARGTVAAAQAPPAAEGCSMLGTP